jgi:peptide/nickel transport system permease protein
LYLLFAVRGLLPMELAPETALLAVTALIGCAGWATPARLARAWAQSVLTMDYVRASRSFGATRWHVLRHHALPGLGPLVGAQLFTLLPQYVLAESALSLLGLGLSEPTPTWGTLLNAARHQIASGLHWWTLAPVAPITILTLASAILAGPREEAP